MTTTKPTREQTALDSMIDGPREVAGIALRPFSFGSSILARKMGLRLFYEQGVELSEEETLDQLAAFFWMQCEANAPREVLRAVNSGKWREEVEAFAMELPMHKLPEMLSELQRVSNLASAAAVDIEPRPGGSDPDEPGN